MSELPVICSFWYGKLSFLEQVCITSFIERGHRFVLHAYEDVGAVPAGCEVRDASETLPRERMFFYKGSRTPAVFADLFRLHLMQEEAGIWADCDVYCVRPLAGLRPYVFGIESIGGLGNGNKPQINNAVFRCPPDSPLLSALLEVFEPGATPPGLPFWRRLEVAVRRALGAKLPVHDMQFGATGPWPLNHHVRALGLWRYAQPKPVFYPLDYGQARRLLAPGLTLAEVIRPETLAVHMWHSALTDRGSGEMARPQPGSFFAGEMERLGLSA